MLFVCHHKHCFQFLLGVKTAPRETENNAYAKFCGDKQRALWYVVVFSGVVNCLRPWTWWVDILVRLRWICSYYTANFRKMFFCFLISAILWRCGGLVFASCSQVRSTRTGSALLQKWRTSWWCPRRGGVSGQVSTPPPPPTKKKKTFVTTHNTLINIGYVLSPRKHTLKCVAKGFFACSNWVQWKFFCRSPKPLRQKLFSRGSLTIKT